MPPVPTVLPAGDSALVAEYGDVVDAGVNTRVRQLQRVLETGAPRGVIELVPTYRSLMVHYDPLALSYDAASAWIVEAAARVSDQCPAEARTVDIPVLYGGEEGPDLADVAAMAGLREEDVVGLHASGAYLVFLFGFMPGFPYLGGLPPRLATPRLDTPRTVVPAGSVGIAGHQTGIYPTESPGGWRLIGRTPVRLFDPLRTPPAPP